MLSRLRQHPLLAGADYVLDAVRYLALMAVLVVLLGYFARSAARAL